MLLVAALLFAPMMYGACTYSLSPSGRSHGYGATNNFIGVNAEASCAWNVTNNNSWITILSGASGTGTGVVNYAVSQNTNYVGRTGIVTIATQAFTIRQDPAPCKYSLTPTTRTHGPGAVNNTFDVATTAGCAWSVINTNPWITFPGTTEGLGNGTVPYAVAANTTPVQRTGDVLIADEVFVLIQRAASCLYELSPTNRSHGYAGSTGLVSVSTAAACSWTVENTNPWITITVNPTGMGPGTFGYNVAPNPNNTPRTGTFSVWDQVFTVYQALAPCSFSIAPSSASISADRDSNVVNITGTSGCSWGVTNTNSWITVFPLSGAGNGVVTWSVPDNAGNVGRTGVVSIAGENFTIRQAAGNCTYRLSPTNRTHGYAATTNYVALDTLNVCSWNVVNTNTWVTITSGTSGLGDSNITYSLSANEGVDERSGVIVIGGQQFMVSQRGINCAVNVSPVTRNHGNGAATNFITVTSSPGCPWNVTNTAAWITIVSNLSRNGYGTVDYIVAANPTPFVRIGTIFIEEASVTITQAPLPCVYSVTPTKRTHGYGAASNIFNVTTINGCSWVVTNTNSWVAITAATSGTNSDTVSYAVEANPNFSDRVAVLTVDGQTFTITQLAAVCSFSLVPSTRNHGYGSTTGTVTVATTANCGWSVVNSNSWITILSGSGGIGTGVVSYAVSSNISFSPRSGSLLIADQTFVVTQAAYLCTYKLSPTNRTHGFGANTGMVSVTAGPSCNWAVANTNDWITIMAGTNGTGNGSFTYSIAPNFGTTTRTGLVFLADEVLTLSQLSSMDGFSFQSVNLSTGGAVTLKLQGGPPGIWEIQGSTNLLNWSRIGDITNTTGRVEYTIPSAGNRRFYRAVLP